VLWFLRRSRRSERQAQRLSPIERLQGGGVAQWLLITSVIFLASTLQSMTGFGFAVLAVPLLPPRVAVALITLLSTATTVLAWWRIRAETAPGWTWRLFIAGLLG